LAQNHLQEALREFHTALGLKDGYYPALIGVGKVYLKMGRIAEAAASYQKAVEQLDPSYASDHVLRGDYFFENRKYKKAIKDYWEVLRIDPQAGNQYTLAMRHLRHAQDDKKIIRQAVKAFEQAVEIDEDYADPYFQLGNLYFHDDKLKKAVDPYAKAVDIEPKNSLYRFALGTALYKQGTAKAKVDMKAVEDATAEFEEAMVLGRRDARLHFNLGTCYVLLENYDEAIVLLEEAIKRGLRDEEVFFNLGNANFRKAMMIDFTWDGYDSLTTPELQNMNNDKFAHLFKAVQLYELALKQKDDYAQVYYDLGVAYYRLSELKLTPDFIPKVTRDQKSKEEYMAKGVQFFQTDMLQRAVTNFKRFQSNSSDGKKKSVASKIESDLKKQIKEFNK